MDRRTVRRVPILALWVVAGACVESGWTLCADGRRCEPGSVCDLVNGTCASPEADCFRAEDGTRCGGGQICLRGSCVPSCGDGVVNGDDECEGDDVQGLTCAAFDRYAGEVVCSECAIDPSRCSGSCMDGSLDPSYEACDPTDARTVAGIDCMALGFDAGRQGCASDCGSLTDDACAIFGWTVEDPFAAASADESMQDIWATPDDLYVLVSPGGVRSAGQAWAGVGGDAADSVRGRALWASSSADLWVVNATGDGFLHWNGAAWVDVASPSAGLNEIWGSSASDVFAAGDRGVVVHFDGTGWTEQPTPAAGDLRAIWGIAAGEVYAAGEAGTLLRYDGREWSAIDSGTTETLTGVWASSGDDIWTIGAANVRHFDGSRWSVSLQLDGASGDRGWISGTGASDLWISAGGEGSVRRYDGATWSTLLEGDLAGPLPLWVDRTEVVVGSRFPGLGVAVRRWYGAGSGPFLATSGEWSGAWGTRSDAWIAVGADPITKQGVALHADGSTFAFDEPLLDVSGFDPDHAYALGSGTIFEWNGTRWSVARPADDTTLRDLWTSGTGDVHALTSGGQEGARVLHFDGVKWTELPPLEPPCGALAEPERGWASSARDVLVVGDNVLARFDGSVWSYDAPTTCDQHFTSVWGSGPGDVWVFQPGTDDGAVASRLLHWDGAAWSSQDAEGGGALFGTAADDVFLGAELHYDGRAWSPMRLGGAPAVFATPSRIFLVGVDGQPTGLGQFVRTRFWNQRVHELDCGDGVDDDADGLSDSDDDDCADAVRGAP